MKDLTRDKNKLHQNKVHTSGCDSNLYGGNLNTIKIIYDDQATEEAIKLNIEAISDRE
jgi:hypothetical protein